MKKMMWNSATKYATFVFAILWISETADTMSISTSSNSTEVVCAKIDGRWFSILGAELNLPAETSTNNTTAVNAATLSANNGSLSLIGFLEYDSISNSSNTTFTIRWTSTNNSFCSRFLTGECVMDENREILVTRLYSSALSSTQQTEQRNVDANGCDSILETLFNVNGNDEHPRNFSRKNKNPMTDKSFFGGGGDNEGNAVTKFFSDPFGLGSWWNSLLGSLSATVIIAFIIIIMCCCCPICITVRSWCKAIRHCSCCHCRCCRNRDRQFDVVDARYRRDMKPLKGNYKKYRK